MSILSAFRLPSRIALVLKSAGDEAPPLQWVGHVRSDIKAKLEAMDDDRRLFGRQETADAAMGEAVRGLLYLWNGLLDDCRKHADAAPELESLYISGLCARHDGQPNEARLFFERMQVHPIFEPLGSACSEIIGIESDPPLERLRAMIEQNDAWAPVAFIEIYEQVRVGGCPEPVEQAVRRIQCCEFEMFFRHCYESATGRPLPRRVVVPMAGRRSNSPSEAAHRATAGRRHAAPGAAAKAQPTFTAVSVLCPKCEGLNLLPESARGRPGKCKKCGAAFLVPLKAGYPAGAGASTWL